MDLQVVLLPRIPTDRHAENKNFPPEEHAYFSNLATPLQYCIQLCHLKQATNSKSFGTMTHHFSFFKLDYSAILSAKCVCVYVVYTISILKFEYAVISACRFNMF